LATSNNKLKSIPKVARTTTIGPSPKRSRKWNNRRLKKVQHDQVRPQDGADTTNKDFDILSKAELDLFMLKIDAINADLDSIYGKDEPYPERRESDEDSRDRILLNNRCHVVSNICKHLRYYRTLRELQVKRTGRNHEDLYDYGRRDSIIDVTPQSERPVNLLHPRDFNISTPRYHATHQETEKQTTMIAHEILEEDADIMPPSPRQSSRFATPATRSNPVTPDPFPPHLDRVVKIVEEDDSIVDVTPQSERPPSPSIIAGLTNRLRAIRAMVHTQSKEPTIEQETSANDSISLASFTAMPSTAAVNSRIEHDSNSSPSDSDPSDASSSLSSDSSSDSSKKSTCKYKKSKLKRSKKKSNKKKKKRMHF
jgi:hypothetical protein